MNRFGYTALVWVLIGCSQSAFIESAKTRAAKFYGTGSHGSGGGETGVAWFPHGDREVRYCVFSGGESSSRELIRSAFEQGFATVREYYLSKGVHQNLPVEKRLATKIRYVDSCESSDLILYPGTPEDDSALSEFERLALKTGRASLNNPPSFAFRTDDPRDARTWASGYLWIAPEAPVGDQNHPWRLAPLTGVVAHEIGHIFGLPHIPGTLMASSYARRLLTLAYTEKRGDRSIVDSFLSLDSSSELFVCESSLCPLQNYHGLLGEPSAVFEKIVGRFPQGNVSARVYVRRFPGQDESKGLPAKYVQWSGTVADDLGDYRFYLEVDTRPLEVKTGLELFRNIWSDTPLLFGGQSYQARLHTLNGERIPVQIQRNHAMGNGSRLYIGDGDGKSIFFAHTHESLLSAHALPKPDLRIVDSNPESGNTVSVRISNAGASNAWGTNVIARQNGHWIGAAWVPPLKAGESVSLSVPLDGIEEIPERSELGISDQGLGSEQLSITWRNERALIYRDQLFLPKSRRFEPSPSPITIEVDPWNSLLESDESNNLKKVPRT